MKYQALKEPFVNFAKGVAEDAQGIREENTPAHIFAYLANFVLLLAVLYLVSQFFWPFVDSIKVKGVARVPVLLVAWELIVALFDTTDDFATVRRLKPGSIIRAMTRLDVRPSHRLYFIFLWVLVMLGLNRFSKVSSR